MESMRATWTDSRLDDLNDRVSDLADRMDGDFRELRGEVGSLHRTIIQIGGGLIGTLLVASIGLIATQL
jgi:hypothetical protein